MKPEVFSRCRGCFWKMGELGQHSGAEEEVKGLNAVVVDDVLKGDGVQ